MRRLLAVADEIRDALAGGRPVVALETTLVAHGFPAPTGVEVALESDAAVRSVGAIPATIGILDGTIRVGLDRRELDRFTPDARKTGPRDLAACAVGGEIGATTVGATLTVAAKLGIRFVGTGGIGGVHRGFPDPPDVSADVAVLACTQALVVSSGIKSLLDVAATSEVLETVGVPVLGYRTDTLPRFYAANGGPSVSRRVDDVAEAAEIARAHWELGGAGLLLGNPPPASLDVDDLIEETVAAAARAGVSGQAVTPWVLASLHEQSGGRTQELNRALVVANARLAGEAAVAFAAL